MPAALPTVTVQNGNGASCALPEVFLSPIRADIVNAVHTGMAKNHRACATPRANPRTARERAIDRDAASED